MLVVEEKEHFQAVWKEVSKSAKPLKKSKNTLNKWSDITSSLPKPQKKD